MQQVYAELFTDSMGNHQRHIVVLQVTKSLVDHLNSSMKLAIDKADDAEAEAAHIQVQVGM